MELTFLGNHVKSLLSTEPATFVSLYGMFIVDKRIVDKILAVFNSHTGIIPLVPFIVGFTTDVLKSIVFLQLFFEGGMNLESKRNKRLLLFGMFYWRFFYHRHANFGLIFLSA